MWVSGSLIRSSTWRSSSVSAPCISSSICLPSSPDRSRTMRGSFCQALPIGCMRVFMTPSCSSAVTLESRCSGTLNSVSSWRRRDLQQLVARQHQLRHHRHQVFERVDVDADRLVGDRGRLRSRPIRRRFSSAAGFAAALAGRGLRPASAAGGGATSIAVSRNARSSSSSDTSPGRSGRSRICGISVPCSIGGLPAADGVAIGAADADIAAMPRSTICCSSTIRSWSVPSGSASVASSLREFP